MSEREKIWKLEIKNTEKIALLFILDNTDEDGLCTASLNLVALRCGYTDRCVASKITNSLARKGLLKIIANGNTAEGITKHNSYIITLDK